MFEGALVTSPYVRPKDPNVGREELPFIEGVMDQLDGRMLGYAALRNACHRILTHYLLDQAER